MKSPPSFSSPSSCRFRSEMFWQHCELLTPASPADKTGCLFPGIHGFESEIRNYEKTH